MLEVTAGTELRAMMIRRCSRRFNPDHEAAEFDLEAVVERRRRIRADLELGSICCERDHAIRRSEVLNGQTSGLENEHGVRLRYEAIWVVDRERVSRARGGNAIRLAP
jgi:hypothetical protein